MGWENKSVNSNNTKARRTKKYCNMSKSYKYICFEFIFWICKIYADVHTYAHTLIKSFYCFNKLKSFGVTFLFFPHSCFWIRVYIYHVVIEKKKCFKMSTVGQRLLSVSILMNFWLKPRFFKGIFLFFWNRKTTLNPLSFRNSFDYRQKCTPFRCMYKSKRVSEWKTK